MGLRKSGLLLVVLTAIVAIPGVIVSFAVMRNALVVHAQSSDAQQITPNKIEFENDQVKVIRGFLSPHSADQGCGVGRIHETV